jgi:hypothetical protein
MFSAELIGDRDDLLDHRPHRDRRARLRRCWFSHLPDGTGTNDRRTRDRRVTQRPAPAL